MSSAMALAPTFALAAITGLVWLTMLIQRAQHMRRHKISPQDMPTRALADAEFGDVQAANNALMNLFELPVLFYVLSVVTLVTGRPDMLFVGAAWAFVALRGVQAAIHVSYNDVTHRGAAYLLSSIVMWLMWVRFGWQTYFA